jgi:hypothetical protein
LKKGIVVLLILLAWTVPSMAETYNSSFGFSINIPSYWLIMGQDQKSKLFDADNKAFASVDKAMLEKMKAMTREGKVEYYFNQNTSDSHFADNINVYKQPGQLPQTKAESNEVSKDLPDLLLKSLGKPVRVYECDLTTVGGLNAFYAEFDGIVDGTTCISYQIRQSPNDILVFTATSKNQSVDIIRKEFNKILSSIKLIR